MKSRYTTLSLTAFALLLTPASLDAQRQGKGKAQGGCGQCCQRQVAPDTSHPIRGVVQRILPEQTALLVAHEEIPGFMPAMTMMFEVDVEVLSQVATGDSLTATMTQTPAGRWRLDDVKKRE